MDRRDFLKQLATLGAAISIPFEAIAEAPEEIFERAWQSAKASPFTFYVNQYGTIFTDGDDSEYTSSRGALYEIEDPQDIEQLKEIADVGRIKYFIDEALSEAEVSTIDELNDDEQFDLLHQVSLWVIGWPDEWDAENATLTGKNCQGDALSFFRSTEFSKELGITIVEAGNSPCSNYFAAELHYDLDETNETAALLGLPIRFAYRED